jgi:hypothetical protein
LSWDASLGEVHVVDRREDLLDEALEGTFPASDPPANTPETGIGLDIGGSDEPETDTDSSPSAPATSDAPVTKPA